MAPRASSTGDCGLQSGDPVEPDDATYYFNRGNAYYSRRDYDHAIQDYDQAIRLKSDFAEASAAAGNAYDLKGDHDRRSKITIKPSNWRPTIRWLHQ